MISLLMVVFLIACFCLVVCVLLQAGKGGGLAAGFGGSGTGFELLGGRQTASFLHQSTRWLGGAFLLIAFLIALLTARGNRPGSLIQRELEGQPQPVQQSPGAPQDLESVIGEPEGDTAGGAASSQPRAEAPAQGADEPAPEPGAAATQPETPAPSAPGAR